VDDARAANDYWGRAGLDRAIVDALIAAGKDLSALTIDDLAPADQFHGGGKAATERLARLAGLHPGLRVLDVGGGLGGPARTLAAQFGCAVTVVDLTESYVSAGRALTALVDLEDRVIHRLGSALTLPEDGSPYDVVWTQNSGMNIEDKVRLYSGFSRMLRPGGLLALQEPMAGPGGPPIFPLMWARDASASFLLPPDDMRAAIEEAGFRLRAWDDVTTETGTTGGAMPPHSIQRIVMGDALDAITRAGERNRDEGRLLTIQAVFERG
jgi:SAM-dependent methyltransferase